MPVPPPHQPQSEQPDPEFGQQVPAVPYVVPDAAAHNASAQYAAQYAQQHNNMLDPAAPDSSHPDGGASASFQYPEGWIRISESYTINNKEGDLPSAELFAAVNNSDSATSMLVYEATKRPPRELTKEEIHATVDQGLARQLAATQEDLASYHSVIAFGCVGDFSYTNKPVIVERNGLYGLRYGYTCFSSQGDITGEYLVGFDTVGRSYRIAVEALDGEWENSKSALKVVVDSVKPNPLP